MPCIIFLHPSHFKKQGTKSQSWNTLYIIVGIQPVSTRKRDTVKIRSPRQRQTKKPSLLRPAIPSSFAVARPKFPIGTVGTVQSVRKLDIPVKVFAFVMVDAVCVRLPPTAVVGLG